MDRLKLKRDLLFSICKDKESLRNWIRTYIGLDMPNSVVDEDSNSCPLDMIWEVYSNGLIKNNVGFSRVLYYASRDSGKTLSEAIIEILCLFHLRRSVVHLAAIKEQSKKAQAYAKDFLRRPILKNFVTSSNSTDLVLTFFNNKQTGETLSLPEYESLTPDQQLDWEQEDVYTRIIVATVQSCNGQHAPMLVLDELEIIQDKLAVQESKIIACPLNRVFTYNGTYV